MWRRGNWQTGFRPTLRHLRRFTPHNEQTLHLVPRRQRRRSWHLRPIVARARPKTSELRVCCLHHHFHWHGRTATIDAAGRPQNLLSLGFLLLRPQGTEHLSPKRLFVLVEAELWPNFLWQTINRRIQMFLINARLSDRSLRGYKRAGFIFRPIFSKFRAIGCQSDADATRLKESLDSRPIMSKPSATSNSTPPNPAHRKSTPQNSCNKSASHRMQKFSSSEAPTLEKKRFSPTPSCNSAKNFPTFSSSSSRATSNARNRVCAELLTNGPYAIHPPFGNHRANNGAKTKTRVPARQHHRRTEGLLRSRNARLRRQKFNRTRRPKPDRTRRPRQSHPHRPQHGKFSQHHGRISCERCHR